MMAKNKLKSSRSDARVLVACRVDWRATYREFERTHGGSTGPVLVRGRLLFPDGWQHSSTDYRGPAWEPPSDPEELRLLKVEYWTELMRTVQPLLRNMERDLREIREAQGERTSPLKFRIVTTAHDADGSPILNRMGFPKLTEEFVDEPVALEDRVKNLRFDFERCRSNLKELTG